MSAGGIQRLVTLPPRADSARQARRFVAEVLTFAGVHPDRVDTAVLLTSELVTNGIVHAHTDLQVTVEATPNGVRVEVVDGNPNLPRKRDGYDDEALTGRGLEMVELLADDLGIQTFADDGKRVWFRLGDIAPEPVGQAVAAPIEVASVVLRRLPVTLYCAWQQHADAILREALIAALDETGGAIPGDLVMASDALGALSTATADVFALREHGIDHADVTVTLPRDVVPHFPVLRDVLLRCSAMSLVGELLVPPALPEIESVRNWVCGEVERQTAGLEPSPYADQPATDLVLDVVAPTTLDAIRTARVGIIAADRSNRIVAVSRVAAQLVGWEPAELEGHRLVAVIPPRLRDAHVAGFTRYLIDHTSSIFGTSVEMPALHRDGREVLVRLSIERARDPQAGEYFVATVAAV